MFQVHPSHRLQTLFRVKPWQGANPEHCRFLFVGLDANYAPAVESSPLFASLLHYHEDGPAFWRETGVHHPFLLPGYKGDGRRYHLTFAKIGFQPKHADAVSFIETLDVPTVGRNVLTAADLGVQHLAYLRHVMFHGHAQFIFVPAGVQRLLLASGRFPELAAVRRVFAGLRVLHEDDDRAVFLHLHFSNYGKFEAQLQAERQGIAELMVASEAGFRPKD